MVLSQFMDHSSVLDLSVEMTHSNHLILSHYLIRYFNLVLVIRNGSLKDSVSVIMRGSLTYLGSIDRVGYYIGKLGMGMK